MKLGDNVGKVIGNVAGTLSHVVRDPVGSARVSLKVGRDLVERGIRQASGRRDPAAEVSPAPDTPAEVRVPEGDPADSAEPSSAPARTGEPSPADVARVVQGKAPQDRPSPPREGSRKNRGDRPGKSSPSGKLPTRRPAREAD